MKDVEIVVVYRSQEDAHVALPEAQAHSEGARAFMKKLRPLFSPIPGAEVNVAALSPEANGTIAQMRRYFVATAPEDEAEELVKEIAATPSVETAYTKPQAENPLAPRSKSAALEAESFHETVDAPSIPDFTGRQGYLDAAPGGVDSKFAWRFRGGDGSGVTIIDVEGGWQLSHVDLAVNSGGLIGGTQYPDVDWRNHGTAVLAQMGGDKNDFGVVGISHGAVVGAVSHGSIGSAKAIQLAAQKLKAGDIILLEMHRPGPRTNFKYNDEQTGYIGVEWWPDDLLAIQFAVAKGIVVVEAAGNGAENLDDPMYDKRGPNFPANWKNPFRDGKMSGAILVGAGAPPSGKFGPDRSRLDFSNYGSRVDCQGWGRGVVTAGYGDLYKLAGVPNDEDSWFTSTFSGTSSASPIVAGTVACLQGIARAQGKVLTGAVLRKALQETGSPQTSNVHERIGTRPDLRKLIARLFPGLAIPHAPAVVDTVSGIGTVSNGATLPAHKVTDRASAKTLRRRHKNQSERSLGVAFLAEPDEVQDNSAGGVKDLDAMLTGWRKERLSPSASDQVIAEITIGSDDSLEAAFLEVLAKRRQAVGIIWTEGVNYEGDRGNWSGTGFLVAPNILLTNHHVVNSIDVARAAFVAFDYEISAQAIASGRKPAPTPGRTYQLRPERLFVTSPFRDGLDYTFVWIEDVALPEGSLISMERAAFSVQPGERAFIIHHPSGNPKRVSLDDTDIVTARPDGAVIHYTSDTEPGSSGSPVFDRSGRLIGLHHASRYNDDEVSTADGVKPEYVNEGIKIAAIALDLEKRRVDGPTAMIDLVLGEINGSDTLAGFFGAAGRTVDPAQTGAELVVDLYKATAQDLDIGFWNIEWFANRYEDKVNDVATLIVDMGLDIWALVETSPAATEKLVKTIHEKFGLKLEYLHSESKAPESKQSTAVIWNPATVNGVSVPWPPEIEKMFHLHSDKFVAEAKPIPKPGKIFDRYPALFHFTGVNGVGGNFDFHLVPLHLKAMADGWERRKMASFILANAVEQMIVKYKVDSDWVLGGDFNAELLSGDFDPLVNAKFTPISAQDEADGALSYLKAPRSMIDHVFLSPNMARSYGGQDFFILAKEKSQVDYLKRFSDHRPVLLRLSARDLVPMAEAQDTELSKAFVAQVQAMLRGEQT